VGGSLVAPGDDLVRSSFGNHACSVFGGTVYDACGRPEVGTRTERAYGLHPIDERAGILLERMTAEKNFIFKAPLEAVRGPYSGTVSGEIDSFGGPMMRFSARATLLALGGAAIAALAAGPDTSATARSQEKEPKNVKEALQFSSWPGKNGPLKPGVKVVPSALPPLSGFTVTKDTLSLTQVGTSPVLLRSAKLANGDDVVRIEIRVSQKNTDEAHEALLAEMDMTQAPISRVAIRGDQNGIPVGDLNFVNSLEPSRLGTVRFVRNNLCVSVEGLNGPMAGLINMAKAIDALILQEPDLSRKELEAQIPVVHQFAPQVNTLAPLSSTPVMLEASDPRGRSLQYRFGGNIGQILVDKSKSPPGVTFRATTQAGLAELSVLVVDENLLFSSSPTEITVKN